MFANKNKRLTSIWMAARIILLYLCTSLLIRTDVSIKNTPLSYHTKIENSMRLRFISLNFFHLLFPITGLLILGMFIFWYVYSIVFVTVIQRHIDLSVLLAANTPWNYIISHLISCFQSALYAFSHVHITLQPDFSKQDKQNSYLVSKIDYFLWTEHFAGHQGIQNLAWWKQCFLPYAQQQIKSSFWLISPYESVDTITAQPFALARPSRL